MTFRLTALPARHGDSLWLEYGSGENTRHVVIDTGPAHGAAALFDKIASLPPPRRIELLVISHVDADHIEGAIQLLHRRAALGLEIGDVWFNGWPQLASLREPAPIFSRDASSSTKRNPLHGAVFDAQLAASPLPWNEAFRGHAAMIAAAGLLPRRELEGGLTLTLLSPTFPQLTALHLEWQRAFLRKRLVPNDPKAISDLAEKKKYRETKEPDLPTNEPALAVLGWDLDNSVANGSSIAFVAEFDGLRCGLFADAHAPTLAGSLKRYAEELGCTRVPLAAAKLSHHGSRANVTLALLAAMDCANFVVSTDGSVFGHPDEEAIALLRARAGTKRIFFNHDCERTRSFGATPSQSQVQLCYPEGRGGAALDLAALAGVASDEHR